ncbi:hypothetical protein SynBIOSU31_01064 [Synechococcus sp. BIOS-U3-1]|uniref:hypothetical protein n=1 Tax=Synechococcus sp. BIOS-U3-1 TaxID=1400865 RepID=UPI000C4F166F|nr:hypothetical protein [Synechococcus sp. BIOS-U3-1]MAD68382.1 hypothetical protein [Synechococcus sp. CPC100]QNI57945.1 hypothetical protein SynBIOSU31_01064 [Synechococcus sp. BIOS-U3-1]
MPNDLSVLNGQRCTQSESRSVMKLHQGDCITLRTDAGLFQVIGIDGDHDRCWVRQWPLKPQGSPVFEVPLNQITPAAGHD